MLLIDALTQTRDAVVAALGTCVPARVQLSPGEIAVDDTDMLAVRLMNAGTVAGRGFGEDQRATRLICGASWAATVRVELWRCVPGFEDLGPSGVELPTADDLNTASAQMARDVNAFMAAVDALAGTLNVAPPRIETVGPLGGTVAIAMNLTINLGAVCPDPCA